MTTYLMLKNIPICEFDIDEGMFKVLDNQLLPFVMRDSLVENDSSLKNYRKNSDILVSFLASRVLPLSRKNAKKILNAFQLSQSQNPYDKARIALVSKGLSMGDSYWLKNIKDSVKWENVNLRTSPLSNALSQIALGGSSMSLQGKIETPEVKENGAYAKSWIREKDGPYLYKKGTENGIQTEIEVCVSNILDMLDIPHVQYYEKEYMGDKVSKCKCMADEGVSIVPASDIASYCAHTGKNLLEYEKEIDAPMLFKTAIVDYLVSNTDRHLNNRGYYMDNETGNLICAHPLFDHNESFDVDCISNPDNFESQIIKGCSLKEVAVYGMKHYPIAAKGSIYPSIFPKKEFYESFVDRATELGVFTRIKPLFIKQILTGEKEHLEALKNNDGFLEKYHTELSKYQKIETSIRKEESEIKIYQAQNNESNDHRTLV